MRTRETDEDRDIVTNFALPIACAVLAVDRAVAHRSAAWTAMDEAYGAAYTWLTEAIGVKRGEEAFRQAFRQAKEEMPS